MRKPEVQFVPVPVVQERTQYVDRSLTIHEHRAPTDKSVELLNEMQEKALQNLIASIPLKSNDLEGHLTVLKDHMNDGEIFIATAMINGKKVEARVSFNRSELATKQNQFEKVRNLLAEKIATEMLLEPFVKSQERYYR